MANFQKNRISKTEFKRSSKSNEIAYEIAANERSDIVLRITTLGVFGFIVILLYINKRGKKLYHIDKQFNGTFF